MLVVLCIWWGWLLSRDCVVWLFPWFVDNFGVLILWFDLFAVWGLVFVRLLVLGWVVLLVWVFLVLVLICLVFLWILVGFDSVCLALFVLMLRCFVLISLLLCGF